MIANDILCHIVENPHDCRNALKVTLPQKKFNTMKYLKFGKEHRLSVNNEGSVRTPQKIKIIQNNVVCTK